MVICDEIIKDKYNHNFFFEHSEIENHLICQIVGSNIENILSTIKLIEKYQYKGININLGCSSKSILV